VIHPLYDSQAYGLTALDPDVDEEMVPHDVKLPPCPPCCENAKDSSVRWPCWCVSVQCDCACAYVRVVCMRACESVCLCGRGRHADGENKHARTRERDREEVCVRARARESQREKEGEGGESMCIYVGMSMKFSRLLACLRSIVCICERRREFVCLCVCL